MRKIGIHLVLAFIVATQLGCSVRILTWHDNSIADRDYDTSGVRIQDANE